MITLKEARRIQRERETKVILKFLGLMMLVVIPTALLFSLVDFNNINALYYVLIILGVGIVVKFSKVLTLFTTKEFIGTVVNVDIYVVKSQRVKGERSYIQHESLEAEIILKNEKGKTKIKVYPNGDVTSRLCLGDEVAFLRLIDEPVVIKGAYLK